MSITRKCTIEGCTVKYLAKGLCSKHYYRKYTLGNLHKPTIHDHRPAVIEGDSAKIPLGMLAEDGYAIVDKEYAYLDKYKWQLNNNGYAKRGVNGRTLFLHHHIIGNTIFKKTAVDHINRNKLDNRKNNLRIVSYSKNALNTGLRRDNSTGYKNIYYDKKRNVWRVSITRQNVTILDKSGMTKKEALKLRDEFLASLD